MNHGRDETVDQRPVVSLLAAVAANGVIGREGSLPWHLPADLRHFKALTTGRTVVMGRRTFESIGRPLPNRRSIVITRQADFSRKGVLSVNALDHALAFCGGEDEVFVIGGAAIYRLAMPLADRLYLTRVHADMAGDVYFPDWSEGQWQLIESRHHPADDQHVYAMTFETYGRREASPDATALNDVCG